MDSIKEIVKNLNESKLDSNTGTSAYTRPAVMVGRILAWGIRLDHDNSITTD